MHACIGSSNKQASWTAQIPLHLPVLLVDVLQCAPMAQILKLIPMRVCACVHACVYVCECDVAPEHTLPHSRGTCCAQQLGSVQTKGTLCVLQVPGHIRYLIAGRLLCTAAGLRPDQKDPVCAYKFGSKAYM
eukprot:1159177-Pelagomonas_calceolata.AAC.17